jgi:hypothetical protein
MPGQVRSLTGKPDGLRETQRRVLRHLEQPFEEPAPKVNSVSCPLVSVLNIFLLQLNK